MSHRWYNNGRREELDFIYPLQKRSWWETSTKIAGRLCVKELANLAISLVGRDSWSATRDIVGLFLLKAESPQAHMQQPSSPYQSPHCSNQKPIATTRIFSYSHFVPQRTKPTTWSESQKRSSPPVSRAYCSLSLPDSPSSSSAPQDPSCYSTRVSTTSARPTTSSISPCECI